MSANFLQKIYSSDFLTTFYDNDLWFIPQQVRFLAGSFWTSRSPHEIYLEYPEYYEDEGILDEMEQWVEDFLNAVPANKREYFSRLIRENTEY